MRTKLLAAVVFAAAIALVVVPAGTASATTECNNTYSNTTFKGGVVVNEGDFCVLDNVTVNGGLTVNGTAFDTFLDIENSTINGPLAINGAFMTVNNSTIHGGWTITGETFPFTDLCGNNIDGGLAVTNAELFGAALSFGELNAGCAGGTINGDASFANNDGAVELDGYKLNGALNLAGNPSSFNELEATAVQGSASCQNVVDDGTSSPLVNSYTGTNNGCPA